MHTGTLEGKQALVTGGSRGIGRGIVQRLRAEGATVVFGYRESGEAAAEVEQATGAIGVQADLATADGVARFLSEATERLSGLDILVNNAAASVKPSLLADLSDDDFDRVMAVNTRAVFLAMRHAAQVMRDGGRPIGPQAGPVPARRHVPAPRPGQAETDEGGWRSSPRSSSPGRCGPATARR